MQLKNKVAIVTGAASGIGRAVAGAYVGAGARVVFADCNLAGVTAATEALNLTPAQALPLELDVTRQADIERTLCATIEAYGGVDILFSAAGVHHTRALLEVSQQRFERLMNVNVFGLFYLLQACARRMIEQGRGGKIVNVASIAGREGRPLQLEYNVSKAAVISLTRSAAHELIPHGINVNAIAPGAIVTGMWNEIQRYASTTEGLDSSTFDRRIEGQIPARRLGTPADLLGAVIFLASSASDYVVGQTLNIDGGMIMC